MNVITGQENIARFRLATLISACKLEGLGLRRRGPSALSILKRELNLKGNREKILKAAQEVLDSDETLSE